MCLTVNVYLDTCVLSDESFVDWLSSEAQGVRASISSVVYMERRRQLLSRRRDPEKLELVLREANIPVVPFDKHMGGEGFGAHERTAEGLSCLQQPRLGRRHDSLEHQGPSGAARDEERQGFPPVSSRVTYQDARADPQYVPLEQRMNSRFYRSWITYLPFDNLTFPVTT